MANPTPHPDGSVCVGFLHPGEWADCFGQSLVTMYLHDAYHSHRLVPGGRQFRENAQSGGIVAGRNRVAQKFLDDTDCEWLFMVDSDMGFGPSTVDDLIAAADPVERPVVGGLCFALRADGPGEHYGRKYIVVPTLYEFGEDNEGIGFRSILDYPRDQMVRVAGTGAACVIMHRSALVKLREKLGDHWYDPVTYKGITFSEDLSFCIQLAAAGSPLWVNTAVRTEHYKGGVYLDEREYDRCRAWSVLEAAAEKEAREVFEADLEAAQA